MYKNTDYIYKQNKHKITNIYGKKKKKKSYI